MIGQLLQGWFKMLFSPYCKAVERKNICLTCEKRKGLFCGECGCVINAKVNCSMCDCPLEKW